MLGLLVSRGWKNCSRRVSGWHGSPARLGGVRIEHFDDVPCRALEWRVAWNKPMDLKEAPEIPENAQGKLLPVD